MHKSLKKLVYGVSAFGVFALTASLVQAAPITDPADVTSPVVETYEGYVGVDIPQSNFGPTTGLPPTNFVFDSGVVLTGPSPNTDNGLIIGDNATYGCCAGGVSSPADIISGTAFAGEANPADGGTHTYQFPAPVEAFGLYFMSDDDVTLTAFDGGGNVIETQVFAPQTSPLTTASFAGILAQTPIASFSIESPGFYVYDDLTFGGAVVPPPPPEPPAPAVPVPVDGAVSLALLVLLLGGLGLVYSRRP